MRITEVTKCDGLLRFSKPGYSIDVYWTGLSIESRNNIYVIRSYTHPVTKEEVVEYFCNWKKVKSFKKNTPYCKILFNAWDKRQADLLINHDMINKESNNGNYYQ